MITSDICCFPRVYNRLVDFSFFHKLCHSAEEIKTELQKTATTWCVSVRRHGQRKGCFTKPWGQCCQCILMSQSKVGSPLPAHNAFYWCVCIISLLCPFPFPSLPQDRPFSAKPANFCVAGQSTIPK